MPGNTKVAPTVVPAVFFIASGAGKVTGQDKSLEMQNRLGVGDAAWRAIGATEVLCGAGTLLGFAERRIGLASKAVLGVLSVAAIVTHLRKRDPVMVIPSALVLAALAASEVPSLTAKSQVEAPAGS